MTCEQLAKKALKHVVDMNFSAYTYATEGGPCGGGWEDDVDLELSRPELMYLINQHIGYDFLFKGIEEKEFDKESHLSKIAFEGAWGYSEPYAKVNDCIPCELEDLAEELETLSIDDEESLEEIHNKLRAVPAGNYTFSFSIGNEDYEFTDDATEELELTANEVLGLLYGKYNLPEVFSILNISPLNDDFINKKAEEKDLVSEYDPFNYGGYSESLDYYLESWEFLLDQIFDGEIDEENLDSWLEYFDDTENFDCNIKDWYDFK